MFENGFLLRPTCVCVFAPLRGFGWLADLVELVDGSVKNLKVNVGPIIDNNKGWEHRMLVNAPRSAREFQCRIKSEIAPLSCRCKFSADTHEIIRNELRMSDMQSIKQRAICRMSTSMPGSSRLFALLHIPREKPPRTIVEVD